MLILVCVKSAWGENTKLSLFCKRVGALREQEST